MTAQEHGGLITAGVFVAMIVLKAILPERFWESDAGKGLVRILPSLIGGVAGALGFSVGDPVADVAAGSGFAAWAQNAWDAIQGTRKTVTKRGGGK